MNVIRRLVVALACCLPAAALAESQVFNDWTLFVTDTRDTVTAMTSSDTGTTLGLVCRKEFDGCYWAIMSGNTCNENSESSYLINSDVGVAAVDTLCQVSGSGNNFVLLKPFETVESIVKEARSLGIAIPMKDGKFRVLRFSLAGSNDAIEGAYRIHAAMRSHLGDEVL